jgi:hypothetical protein
MAKLLRPLKARRNQRQQQMFEKGSELPGKLSDVSFVTLQRAGWRRGM